MRPSITLRIGAAHDEVVIDGHTFDRSGLDRKQRNAMASLIIESLGFPERHRPRGRRFRSRPHHHKNRRSEAHA